MLHRGLCLGILWACGSCGPSSSPDPAVGVSAEARGSARLSALPASASSRLESGPAVRSAAGPATGSAAGSAAPVSEEEGASDGPNEGCKRRKSTNITSHCAAATERLGTWSPSPKELSLALPLIDGTCYCASGLLPAVEACANKVNSGQIAMTLGKLGDATDCSVVVGAAELGGRHFLRFYAPNRDLATFYSIITVVELKGDKAELYYKGFNSFDPPPATGVNPEQHSASLVKDWAKLPKPFKAWLEKDPPAP